MTLFRVFERVVYKPRTHVARAAAAESDGDMAVSVGGEFKANLAQLPDVDGIESITLTFKDTGERCGGVRPASWRSCMCSRRRVQERIPESAHRAIFAQM